VQEQSSPSDAVRDAVVAVIAEHGLAATSVRRVAARAGLSIGAVQHHYPTKDAMLAAAMERVEEVHRQRLAEETQDVCDQPEARLRATVRSLVPRSPDDRSETSLWLAFVARAAVHEATVQQHRATWQRAEDGIAWLISGCADRAHGKGSSAAPPSEPSHLTRDAAAELLALVDGLAVAVLLEPGRMPPERARQLVDDAVDRVLGRSYRRSSPTDKVTNPAAARAHGAGTRAGLACSHD